MPDRDLPRRPSPPKKGTKRLTRRKTSRSPLRRRGFSPVRIYVDSPFRTPPARAASPRRSPAQLFSSLKRLDPTVQRTDYLSNGSWDVDGLRSDLALYRRRVA